MNMVLAPSLTILLAVEAFLVVVAWVRVRPIHRRLGVGMAAANAVAVALGAVELIGTLAAYVWLFGTYVGDADRTGLEFALQVWTAAMWGLVPLAHGIAGLVTVACLAHAAGRLSTHREGWAGDRP